MTWSGATHRFRFGGFLAVPLLGALLTQTGSAVADTRPPARLATPAEDCNYRCTPSLEETLNFVDRLARQFPGLSRTRFGLSAWGRDLPLLVLGKEGVSSPEQAHAAGLPVVLVVAGIHAGEIDGKDAALLLLSEFAAGIRRDLLESVTVLIVPIFNVDGHERVSLHHRPNQNGPVEGMGFRTTATGLDLNRDFLKLDTREARSLVALIRNWNPHLVVDLHVTNGVEHGWLLTQLVPEAPYLAEPVAAWVARALVEVEAAMRKREIETGPYVDLIDDSDPSRGFATRLPEPRYLVSYLALRHLPGILVETHAHRPFRDRVLATHAVLVSWLEEIARSGRQLVSAVATARLRAVAQGQRTAPPSNAVVRWKKREADRKVVPLAAFEKEQSAITGTEVVRYRQSVPEARELPWWHGHAPDLEVVRPQGYLLEPGWDEVELRLVAHGLAHSRLERELSLEVESLRIERPRFASSSYQGRVRVEGEVSRVREIRSFPARSLWIPAAQPDFEIAIQLFEPEAPDSQFQWGAFSSVLELKEWISEQVLASWAEQRLLEEPALATEWQTALADASFAGDSWARYLWWFARHPSWEAARGRLPVARVLRAPAELR